MNVLRVDILFNNGVLLDKCAVYKKGSDGGPVPIEVESDLYDYFGKKRTVHVSNTIINGHIRTNEVKRWWLSGAEH